MVASYLLNPAKHGFELADTVFDHLGRQIPSAKEVVGSGAKAVPFAAIAAEKAADYACRRADAVMGLAAELSGKIAAADMEELLAAVEMPLVTVLAAMERKGVLLDRALLKHDVAGDRTAPLPCRRRRSAGSRGSGSTSTPPSSSR